MKRKYKCICQFLIFLPGITVLYSLCGRWAVLIVILAYIAADCIDDYLKNRKIRNIYDEIECVLNGDYSVSFNEYQEGELSILQNNIHKLVIRLNEQALQLKKDKCYLMDALADISHQLKTPLTSVNIILSFLTEENLTYDERLNLTGRLANELGHIDELIKILLKLSKLDAGMVEFQKNNISTEKLIETTQDGLAVLLELKDIKLEKNIQEQSGFCGDFQWTKEALENIVKNCMEHTPCGGKITIQSQENPIYTEIIIQDNGTGIDKEDLPHLFERFYRGKGSESTGIGIGLSLAAEVIHRQNGIIQVKNRSEGGVLFLIRFYKILT